MREDNNTKIKKKEQSKQRTAYKMTSNFQEDNKGHDA